MKLVPFNHLEHSSVAISGDVSFKNDEFRISFSWQDPKKEIAWPKRTAITDRKENMWRETCFEFFVSSKGRLQYFECHFDIYQNWNIYSLSGYRKNLTPIEAIWLPQIDVENDTLSTTIPLSLFDFEKKELRVQLSAIVNLKSGEETFWSLRHSRERPDFHHFDDFFKLTK